MRATSFVIAVGTFFALAASNPVEREKALPNVKLLERAFGPQDSWPKIRAIDVLPAGTLDSRGQPIDETHIFSYGPWEVDKRQSEIMKRNMDDHYGKRSTLESTTGSPIAVKRSDTDSTLNKRDTHFEKVCYNSGKWVRQDSLSWGAHSSGGGGQNFCQVAWSQWNSNNAQRSFAASKQWYYHEGSNTWNEFTAENGGGRVLVYYELTQFANWSDPTWCAALFDDLIWGCGGEHPDSAGGAWTQYDGNGCWDSSDGVQNCPYNNPPWFTANFVGKIDPYDNTY